MMNSSNGFWNGVFPEQPGAWDRAFLLHAGTGKGNSALFVSGEMRKRIMATG